MSKDRQPFALFIALVALVCIGCATFKHVVRTVNDLAADACMIFGNQNPEEFEYMLRQRAPQVSKAHLKAEFSVKDACKVHEVLKPFIDSQLDLQNETARQVRARMESPNAVAPQQ